mmetsp:Transcript_56204/g.130932  ORF Transcript_56204/g.130932 Transcript_56204/m.130932 type:complete len:377 (-) Transcript_56204:119-1249(-)
MAVVRCPGISCLCRDIVAVVAGLFGGVLQYLAVSVGDVLHPNILQAAPLRKQRFAGAGVGRELLHHSRRQCGRTCGPGFEEQNQVAVELDLHEPCVDVVGISAKRLLNLDGNCIQRPIHEDLQEAEERAPPRPRDPLCNDERSDDPMQDEEVLTRLRVREWERHSRDLQRFMERDHAVREFLEGSRKQGWWYREHLGVDVVHYELLDPLEGQLWLGFADLDGSQTLAIKACRIQELIREGLNLLFCIMALLDLSQCHSVQHAEEPHEDLLELPHPFLVSARVPAESDEAAACVKPLRSHQVHRGHTVPEACVGLRGPEHDQEAHKKDKPTPGDIVRQHVPQHVNVAQVCADLDRRCESSHWQRHAEGVWEHASRAL